MPARSSAAPNSSDERFGVASIPQFFLGELRRRKVKNTTNTMKTIKAMVKGRLFMKGYASFLARISPTTAGLAFPLESFMTWPFKKFSAASLPDL